MLLDLRTIYFIVAVSCFVLRILQLAAYATGRFERWPLWWGVSNLLVGVGSFPSRCENLFPTERMESSVLVLFHMRALHSAFAIVWKLTDAEPENHAALTEPQESCPFLR
ncbi:hypothetical protein FHT85_005468 [Rhizobium sp. BK312]|nr:hypothetical protein [Rhizobium sp. BK312]